MKTTRIYTLLAILMIFAVSCNKPDSNDSDVRVTTYTPQDITPTSASCGGDVIVTQGLSLSELGVCWSTESNPTAEDAHTSTRNWNEPFVCSISGLEPSTKYYVRAYALRGLEYYYGNEESFTTQAVSGLNGHDYVDLGLPSGTLWAICNVGANAPEEYGDRFAWGETSPKTTYNWWNTYKYCWDGDDHQLMKYCNLSNYGYNGFTDNLTTLIPNDDAASSNWGNGWCMPSKSQWDELNQSTTHIWTTQNGVNGCLFTASNGNTLFLPATGPYIGDGIHDVGTCGLYWSSSLCTDCPNEAWAFSFYLDYCYYMFDRGLRSYGWYVRPVRFVNL